MAEERIVDVVLYYTRKVFVKPSFESIKNSNPELDTDKLLDIYSEALKKYQKVENYIDDSKNIISTFVLIPQNENFIENIQKFESNDVFIEWSKNSKELINEILNNNF